MTLSLSSWPLRVRILWTLATTIIVLMLQQEKMLWRNLQLSGRGTTEGALEHEIIRSAWNLLDDNRHDGNKDRQGKDENIRDTFKNTSKHNSTKLVTEQNWLESRRVIDEAGPTSNNHATTTASDKDDDDIRRWGCHRTETPLIFVHIGKMGGGSVRARFAASALNYTRNVWHQSTDRDAHYAVAMNETHTVRASFCNSGSPNYRYLNIKTFEGTTVCAALTPLGHAAACPIHLFHLERTCLDCQLQHDPNCHRVYVGHNLLGNELHWLPAAWLSQWWQRQQQQHSTALTPTRDDQLAEYWRRLEGPEWCPDLGKGRVQGRKEALTHFQNCSVPLAQRVDRLANVWMQSQRQSPFLQRISLTNVTGFLTNITWPSILSNIDPNLNWGPVYASLPVLRTTLVRHPFGWFLSKFFWHSHHKNFDCANTTAAVGLHASDWFGKELQDDPKTAGWAHRMARQFIIQLCGEDCQSRWDYAVITLGKSYRRHHEEILMESFERQADYNLRHSFAVVGQLEDMTGFYDMITARVQYVNMSRNLHVVGKRHRTHVRQRCKDAFKSDSFQRALIKGSPAVAAAMRLYQTALRVNEFQKKELSRCPQRS